MKIYEGMIIVTDLDGTFLGRGECVPERNLRAVAEFVEKGGRFTVSTGRMMVDLDRALPDAVHLCNAPLITSNGALIYDAVQQRVLSEHPMDKADTLALLQWLRVRFPTTGGRVATNHGALTDGEGAVIGQDIVRYKEGQIRILSLEDWDLEDPDERWYKLVLRDTSEVLDEVRAAVRAAFAGRFTFADSAPAFFELNAPGCSKANAVRFLRKRYPGARIICCGDYGNDLAMLTAADLAVCPSNATDEVKAVSHLCLCPHTEGLIADLLPRLR